MSAALLISAITATCLYLFYLDARSEFQPGEWERVMRHTENVVESGFIFLWRYVLRPPIFWWTYPARMFWVPLLKAELEQYNRAMQHKRERDMHRHSQEMVDQRSYTASQPEQVTIVDRSTKPRVRVRRGQRIAPDSVWRWVKYTHENGTVEWGLEQIPGTQIEMRRMDA